MKNKEGRTRYIKIALVTGLAGAFSVYLFVVRSAVLSESQVQHLGAIRTDLSEQQARQRSGNALPADEPLARVNALLADGMLSQADLDAIFAELKNPVLISDKFYEFKKSAVPDRRQLADAISASFRSQAEATVADWFAKALPSEEGVRAKFTDHLLDVAAHAKDGLERQGAFVSLNVMGALRDKVIRDKAVSILEGDADAGAHSFIRAWKTAEAELAKQATEDAKGKP